MTPHPAIARLGELVAHRIREHGTASLEGPPAPGECRTCDDLNKKVDDAVEKEFRARHKLR